MGTKISVIIIAQDEEERIANAIGSCLPFADEVLVVDGGSRDNTPAVAERAGARVVMNPWPGYAKQRNHGASLASHDWVFHIDSDEEADRGLASALVRWKENAQEREQAFAVSRVGDFWGAWLDTRKQRLVRLYNRRAYPYVDALVHEAVAVDRTSVSYMDGIIWHRGFRSVSDHVDRFNRYTSLEAQTAFETGRKFSIRRLITRPLARFVQKYVIEQLFRRGMAGLAAALLWMMYEILTELKLYELYWHAEAPNRHPATNDASLSQGLHGQTALGE